MRFRRSHRNTQRSRMCSANRQPQSYHRTGHGIVPLTCCLELYSPRVEYTPCPSWSASGWRITSRRLSNNSSFVLPPPQRPQSSSSWARRTEACGHASTTGPSMIILSSCLILFPWSRPLSRNSVGPASSRSWTCRAPITSFVSGKATSERLRSLPPQATMNIGSCRMAFPTTRLSSRSL